ncbi:MAG: DNA pilot protein [Microvirus sp.]|nr:MAG: DNA pilot protein [Microvirus sp.]
MENTTPPMEKTNVGTAAVGAASGLLGGLVGLGGQAMANKQQRKLSNQAYQRDLAQWNRQNLYNNPTSQMQRLKDAHLNPNLVYGNGTVGNTSAPSPSAPIPEYKLDTSQVVPQTVGGLTAFSNLAQQSVQTDNVYQDTLNKQIDNANKIVQNEILLKQAEKLGVDITGLKAMQPLLIKKLDNEVTMGGLDVSQKKKLQPYQATITKNESLKSGIGVRQAESEYNLNQNKIALIRKELAGKQTSNEIALLDKEVKAFEARLAQMNLAKSDNTATRVFVKYLQDEGISSGSELATRLWGQFLAGLRGQTYTPTRK